MISFIIRYVMRYKRLLFIILLIIIIILLMFYNNLEYHSRDLDFNYILDNFEKYNNSEITITGYILKINEINQTLIVCIQESPFPIFEIKYNNIENLRKFDIIGIYGILDGKNHITAERIWIHEQWKDYLIYARSIPAIPFAIYLFFRSWKFNRKTVRFERRVKDA